MGDEQITGQIWQNGEKVDGFSLASISDHIGESDTLVWADLQCPSHETLGSLASELGLNSFAIEDTISAAERVKTVSYSDHTFIMVYAIEMKTPVVQEKNRTDDDSDDAPPPTSGTVEGRKQDRRAKSFTLHRISIFIKDNALITVRMHPDDGIATVIERCEDTHAASFGVSGLLYVLLDVVVDGHFNAVQVLDDQIEELEDYLFDDSIPNVQLQRRTYDLRKDLVVLRRVVLPMRDVVGTIQRHRYQDRDDHAKELDPNYSDLYDHVLRAAEWTESLRDMLSSAFETNLSLMDARLNTVMKKLTAWAAIIAVPTLITGYYGQNVLFPGYSTSWGVWVSAILIVGSVIVLYINFRKRDWL
ncbi:MULTISPECIES: magnesium transporter CorA family protein [Gordonia]|uniref:magnesium transporter CorA family protein n=1 Tax=Gordonia sp. 852002-10350_SCH5691597 TaxID=1834085 RepID=UPI0007E99489|nr:magnesium transporter CorA family protein [Gordonia sp. 852002-10350_SCH5691597]OBA59270.1 magnesium transporter [Gordonia sp. 852002-10350_SCH5691597]